MIICNRSKVQIKMVTQNHYCCHCTNMQQAIFYSIFTASLIDLQDA